MRMLLFVCVAFSMMACGESERPGGDSDSSESINHDLSCLGWEDPENEMEPDAYDDMLGALGGLMAPTIPVCNAGGVSLLRDDCTEGIDQSDMYYVCNPPAEDLDLETERTIPCIWELHATKTDEQCSYQAACIPEEHWHELDLGSWDDAVAERCTD